MNDVMVTKWHAVEGVMGWAVDTSDGERVIYVSIGGELVARHIADAHNRELDAMIAAPAPNADVPASASPVGAAGGITPDTQALRREYAKAALGGLVYREIGRTSRNPRRIAEKAFELADAMLAAEKERT